MAKVAIIGSGMMGSALAFPILENGHEVSLIGTHLDTEIILNARKTGRHLRFEKDFPVGKINYYTIDVWNSRKEYKDAFQKDKAL